MNAQLHRTLTGVALTLVLGPWGCRTTTQPTQPAGFGVPSSTRALEAHLSEPGPLRVERVVAADWAVSRAGLIDLSHPEAQKAGLTDGDEPVQIYFYAVRHPQKGLYLVDSGIEVALRDHPDRAAVRGLVTMGMNMEALKIRQVTGPWLEQQGTGLAGVLLTHLHVDHILGLPDVPAGTPVYTGPGEANARGFLNAFVQGTTDRTMAHLPPLSELEFQPDPDGNFAGVMDLFGDGSLYAIHVPGHTPGSVAYVARTETGPVLMAGDTCHTRFGWDHHVAPGSFTADGPANQVALQKLIALADRTPGMVVYLGHQP